MKKRITLKEFKRVLIEEAKMDFDTWGYEGILNLLIVAYDSLTKCAEEFGFSIVADLDREKAQAIDDYLRNIGYFDFKE